MNNATAELARITKVIEKANESLKTVGVVVNIWTPEEVRYYLMDIRREDVSDRDVLKTWNNLDFDRLSQLSDVDWFAFYDAVDGVEAGN